MSSDTYTKIVEESNNIMKELGVSSLDEAIAILKERVEVQHEKN